MPTTSANGGWGPLHWQTAIGSSLSQRVSQPDILKVTFKCVRKIGVSHCGWMSEGKGRRRRALTFFGLRRDECVHSFVEKRDPSVRRSLGRRTKVPTDREVRQSTGVLVERHYG